MRVFSGCIKTNYQDNVAAIRKLIEFTNNAVVSDCTQCSEYKRDKADHKNASKRCKSHDELGKLYKIVMKNCNWACHAANDDKQKYTITDENQGTMILSLFQYMKDCDKVGVLDRIVASLEKDDLSVRLASIKVI